MESRPEVFGNTSITCIIKQIWIFNAVLLPCNNPLYYCRSLLARVFHSTGCPSEWWFVEKSKTLSQPQHCRPQEMVEFTRDQSAKFLPNSSTAGRSSSLCWFMSHSPGNSRYAWGCRCVNGFSINYCFSVQWLPSLAGRQQYTHVSAFLYYFIYCTCG
jgi:hypothetical protein